MSLQQASQPKSYANGFGRRRAEREGGARSDDKLQSGKSNLNRSSAVVGGKVGVYESPSSDRLVYLSTCLIGHPVEVHLKNGSVYSGTCYTTNVEKEFAIVLKMARLIRDVPFRGNKVDTLSKASSKTLIINGKDVVQVVAKDVSVMMDGMIHGFQPEKRQDIMIDSLISQFRHTEIGRELERWVPDEDDPQCPELENIFDGPRNSGWDQFETNKMLFGVKSTFDEELYTTKLERGPQMRELEKEATRIAREIESEDTRDLHLAEERGIHLHEDFDVDEETRFSSVYRGTTSIEDSGYEEAEDVVLDSRNIGTFGDTSASHAVKSMDLTHGKISDGAQVLSSSSLDEAQCSQSSAGTDLCHSGSYEHARPVGSEHSSTNLSTSESERRIKENLHGEHGANDGVKEFVEGQTQLDGAQVQTCEDSKSLNGNTDKAVLSSNATVYAPSRGVSSKNNERTGSSGEVTEGAQSVNGVGEGQSVNSCGRPGSSTSSNSDCPVAASVPNRPGLSPSSSMGSLSSEKSTLNPHAKEFKLNPNAKSFTPSQTPVRPPSPVSDGSFYYQPNVPALPHMHAMPVGIGMGPSFTGHQPVIYNPQVAPLQTHQAYFHPGGPQHGQQMLVGHPRQFLYMPSFQPQEMPFKGRDF